MNVHVEGQSLPALLDTGATVSTISRSVVDQLGLPISPTESLNVECANGQPLPYVGCVVANVSLVDSINKPCLFLVVPNQSHTQTVPLLLGTNNLEQLIPGDDILPGPLKLVAACIKQRQKHIRDNAGSIATLKFVGRQAETLPSGCTTSVTVSLGSFPDFPPSHTVVESSQLSQLPGDVEVSPTLHFLKGRGNFQITLHNTSSQTFKVQPGDIIAQLSPAVVTNNSVYADDFASPTQTEVPPTKLPDISAADVSTEEKGKLQKLVEEFSDVFSQGDLDLGHYTGVQHRIELEDDRLFKQRYGRIPPHMMEEVADHLRQLEANGVIRPSKSPFSSPVVCVRKKDGRLRLCVDYRLLNSRTKKTIIVSPELMRYLILSRVLASLAALI